MSTQKAIIQHSTDTEFGTPDSFYKPTTLRLNIFPQLDICATPENTKCKRFFTKEQDAFNFEWNEDFWGNIPFGSKVINPNSKKPLSKGLIAWVQRAQDQTRKHSVSGLLMLPLSASVISKFSNSAEIWIIPKRITFLKNGKPDLYPISKDIMLLAFRSRQNVIDTYYSGLYSKPIFSLRGGIFEI